MDGWVIDKDKRWQSQNLQQAKDNTLALIDKAAKENIEYLGVIFHDRYFCDSFKTWKNWYIWLVQYLKDIYEFSKPDLRHFSFLLRKDIYSF
jgi:hypothetical protein